MMQKKIVLLFIIGTLCIGCSKKDPIPFTYRFSMENINNFKISFQLNPDSSYTVERYNYFFDNYEGKKRPESHKGKLTENEFKTFHRLINKSNIHKMKDAYGFDDPKSERSIIYIIELEQPQATKFVSINANDDISFSSNFTELVKVTSNFIDKKLLLSGKKQ